MLFVIRAVFWLSIVFYFLPWPEDPIASLPAKSEVQSAAQDIWGCIVAKAQTAAERESLHLPEACLKGAAQPDRRAAWHPASGRDKAYGSLPVDAPAPRN
jgi:hypothetical protein